jgi:hypothetical protein
MNICPCQDCDGGCDQYTGDDPTELCIECGSMGMHRQDRDE